MKKIIVLVCSIFVLSSCLKKDDKKAAEKVNICLRLEPENEDYKALLKEINLKK